MSDCKQSARAAPVHKEMMKYIDIHGHINFPVYDSDRKEVIDRARAMEVGIINVGTDIVSSSVAVKLSDENDNMWSIIGLHPVHTGESYDDPTEKGEGDNKNESGKSFQEFDSEQFKNLALNEKVVAIGECGLDYFHSRPEDIMLQKRELEKQIIFANETNKPLMLHVRNGKENKSAYQEAVSMLKSLAKVSADFHFFAGTIDDLKSILDIGGSVSFTGVITFAKNYDELIKYAPLERIMSETDCPYVSPAPYRGKRNEPTYVIEVVKAIARIRGEKESMVADKLVDNAMRFFSLRG